MRHLNSDEIPLVKYLLQKSGLNHSISDLKSYRNERWGNGKFTFLF